MLLFPDTMRADCWLAARDIVVRAWPVVELSRSAINVLSWGSVGQL